jgi:hypothetical protein
VVSHTLHSHPNDEDLSLETQQRKGWGTQFVGLGESEFDKGAPPAEDIEIA